MMLILLKVNSTRPSAKTGGHLTTSKRRTNSASAHKVNVAKGCMGYKRWCCVWVPDTKGVREVHKGPILTSVPLRPHVTHKLPEQ